MTAGFFAAGYGALLVVIAWLFLLGAERTDADGRRSEHGALDEPTWPHADAARLKRALALLVLALAVIFTATGVYLEARTLPLALSTGVAVALTAHRTRRDIA